MDFSRLLTRARRTRDAYKRVFGGISSAKDGEIVLADLIALCKPYDSVLVPGQPDVTGVNEGKRLVFLHLTAQMNLTDDEMRRMVSNYAQEETATYDQPGDEDR
jgi:hypothetical protein